MDSRKSTNSRGRGTQRVGAAKCLYGVKVSKLPKQPKLPAITEDPRLLRSATWWENSDTSDVQIFLGFPLTKSEVLYRRDVRFS